MYNPKIKPVDNNTQKGKTYTKLISKYNCAMKNGYYGEAELIVYAFMEDRLKSFIYHIEGLDAHNSSKINDDMVRIYGNKLQINDMGKKIDVIRKSIKAANDTKLCKYDEYAKLLKTIYKYVNASELNKILNKIDKWREYRNEIVHAMFNKDLDDLRKGYENHVKEGYELARYIDSQIDVIKKI